jgi:small GTP-binding protein
MCKAILLGDAGVGKTCLLNCAQHQGFDESTLPTVGVGIASIDTGKVVYKLWDVAGQAQYRDLSRHYFGGANVAILVFALDVPETLSVLRDWVAQLVENVAVPPKYVVVGNKVDIEPRKISLDEMEAFAKEYDATFFETSAKQDRGIDDLFAHVNSLIDEIAAEQPTLPATVNIAEPESQTGRLRGKGCC